MHRLSGIDTAALALETDSSPLHMMAVLVLDTSEAPGGYSYDRLRSFLASRIHLVPPLLRRLADVPARVHRPMWLEVDRIDWDYHLPRTVSTEPLELARLGALAAELATLRLDRTRPLWQLGVVEDATASRVVLIARVHHALMDGLGGMNFMARLFDLEPKYHPPVAPPSTLHDHPEPSPIARLRHAVHDLPSLPLGAARMVLGQARAVANSLPRPAGPSGRAPLPFTAPRTPFNGRVSAGRTVSLSRLPFEAVREVAQRTETTVNEVVLAAVSGALRRYLSDRGACPSTRLVAGVPAATDDPGGEFANALSFLFVRLATDLDDPVQRLAVARDESRRAKRAGETIGMQTLGAALDLLTPLPIDAAITLYRNVLVERMPPLWNVMVSNVPGPPVPLFVAGARLVGLFPLGPIYEGLGLNVTVVSREQALEVGMVACRDLVPDLDDIATALGESLEELAAAFHVATEVAT